MLASGDAVSAPTLAELRARLDKDIERGGENTVGTVVRGILDHLEAATAATRCDEWQRRAEKAEADLATVTAAMMKRAEEAEAKIGDLRGVRSTLHGTCNVYERRIADLQAKLAAAEKRLARVRKALPWRVFYEDNLDATFVGPDEAKKYVLAWGPNADLTIVGPKVTP